MAIKKVITPDDLHQSDFTVINNKVHAVRTLAPYTVTLANNFRVSSANDGENRRKLLVMDGFGILHLDIVKNANASGGTVGTLPANSPVPMHLLEVQANDGATFYITPNSRTIVSQGARANQRYILNIVGFFRETV